MKPVHEALGRLTEEELRELKRHVTEGNFTDAINERLGHFSAQRVCPVCGTPVAPERDLTLTFGRQLRYRASFDAQDCLALFVAQMSNGKTVTQGLNTQSE